MQSSTQERRIDAEQRERASIQDQISSTTIDFIAPLVARASRKPVPRDGDYEHDGLIFCGKCHSPRQKRIVWNDGNVDIDQLVTIMCKCDIENERIEQEREKLDKFRITLETMRRTIGADATYFGGTFADDEAPNSPISRTCRRYVKRWPEMKKDNMGILLYGSKGTGKSFYASCIANALAERMISTGIVTTSRLMGALQSKWDHEDVMTALCRFQLLVLDDLGAERDTSYGSEQIYNVIDARYRSKRPTIVTTNFDLADMKQETDLWRSRIYDRIAEMCPIAIRMDGESRRSGIADERRRRARELLRGE